MGQLSVLVSVFGGETVKPELESQLVTCDNYGYYCCGLTRDIIGIYQISLEWFYLLDIHCDYL